MKCPHCSHSLPFIGWQFKMKDGNVGQITKIKQGKAKVRKLIGGILCGGEFEWPENRLGELLWQEQKEKIS